MSNIIEYVGNELFARLEVSPYRYILRNQKRYCFFMFTDDDTVAMFDPESPDRDISIRSVFDDTCDYMLDQMVTSYTLVMKTVDGVTYLAIQNAPIHATLMAEEAKSIPKQLYNHWNWPSPRPQRYAKALGSGRLKHADAIDYLASHARMTREDFLNTDPYMYLSRHGDWRSDHILRSY